MSEPEKEITLWHRLGGGASKPLKYRLVEDVKSCVWALRSDNGWMTGCSVFHGWDGHDGYKFCPYCGRKLTAQQEQQT